MTREERLQLNRDRQKAVKEAWMKEKAYVQRGRGAVDWSITQQKELVECGRVKGYEGQHMKSCARYPEYASSVDNIQFLTHEEHLQAHNYGKNKSGYRSPTNGYYDVSTRRMHSFGNSPPREPKVIELSNVRYYSENQACCNNNQVKNDRNKGEYKCLSNRDLSNLKNSNESKNNINKYILNRNTQRRGHG